MANLGIHPRLREIMDAQNKAARGGTVLSCTPATLGSSSAAIAAAVAATGKFTRQVLVQLKDSAGKLLEWLDCELAIAVADTAAGALAVAGGATVCKIRGGVGVVDLEYTGVWAAAATGTLTVTGGTIYGVTVANKTSVDTIVA